MNKLNVTIDDEVVCVPTLMTIEEIIESQNVRVENPTVAISNGHLVRLNQKIRFESNIKTVEMRTPQGKQVYECSVLFLLLVTMQKLYPELTVFIQHTIHRGIYVEVSGGSLLEDDVVKIERKMHEYVQKGLSINKVHHYWDLVLKSLKDSDRDDMINLFRYKHPNRLTFYELDGVEEFLYIPLVPNTAYLKWFQLQKYQNGLVVLLPDTKQNMKIPPFEDRPKIFETFMEYNKWANILNVKTIGKLNEAIMNGEIGDKIKVAEALHEKKIAALADAITTATKVPRVVAIAGPSSSGKTTFSKRLGIQLRVNGFEPVTIEMDNYFVDREKTPVDEDGKYDFEDIHAIDIDMFSDHLNKLLNGEEIELPKFDFQLGRKRKSGTKLRLHPNQIIVIEGIHGLNPLLTSHIDRSELFKIYIAPLTQLNIHRHDRIIASDTRLLRRLVRDHFFRGYSAEDTISRWPSVRRGEKKNIFPLQEEADVIFNSSLFYELAVLKPYAERELLRVEPTSPSYPEAQRLLRFLSFFLPLQTNETPSTSILKEFIGGSTFKY